MIEMSKAVIFHDLSDTRAKAFSKLPPHITLLFLGEVEPTRISRLAKSIKIVADQTPVFSVERGEPALLGENNDIPARTIQDASGGLHDLHSDLLQAAWLNEIEYDSRWTGPSYAPHSTIATEFDIPSTMEVAHMTLAYKLGGHAAWAAQNFAFSG